MNTRSLEILEIISIAVVIVGSAAALVLSFVLDLQVDTLFSMLVPLIGALGLYLLAVHKLIDKRFTRLESEVPCLSREVTQKQWYERLLPLVKAAQESIDITHHEPRVPMISGIEAKKKLFEGLSNTIKRKKKVMVRWIMAINTQEKLDWATSLIEEFADCDNFSLRYSPVNLSYPAPPLSVQVIDSSTAFAIDMAKGHHSASEPDQDLQTTDPEVVKQLRRYYDTYWERSVPLKEAGMVHQEQFELLKSQMKQQNDPED